MKKQPPKKKSPPWLAAVLVLIIVAAVAFIIWQIKAKGPRAQDASGLAQQGGPSAAGGMVSGPQNIKTQ